MEDEEDLKITVDKAIEILRIGGLDPNHEQAATILKFLNLMANIAVEMQMRDENS